MIGRANWWPSELGRDPSTPPTKADRWLRRVKGHRRKAPIPAPKPPHTKVVRNTNGHASKAATKSVPNGKPADLAEGNGEYLIDHLRRHSLPLFGYAAMPAYDVVDGVSKPNGDGATSVKNPSTIYSATRCRCSVLPAYRATTVGMTRLSANPQSVTRGQSPTRS